MMSLFPKDGLFYELFEKQADQLGQASAILSGLMSDGHNLEEVWLKLKDLEREADNVGHEVMDHLRKNFITPLEGEDIDLLRQNLDDIIDFIERAVNRLYIYGIPQPYPKEVGEYVKVIAEAAAEIKEGVKEIKNVKKYHESLHKRCAKLNDLENAGDEINRKALGGLMNGPCADPCRVMEVIKLKEIYETLENAIDCCEDVGNMFESILIKNQ
ncbi:MAG: DUF47 family protein [Candidatus Pacebacteria bacterium]|jgi:hypothetical protein|nr:DUF47 family protein [Candidatus Paceibacterota bacterium]